MRFKTARWVCLAFGFVAMAAWLLFNSPLTAALALLGGVACEVVTWWGLFEQEQGKSDDPKAP
jgi:hypothetical protein